MNNSKVGQKKFGLGKIAFWDSGNSPLQQRQFLDRIGENTQFGQGKNKSK